ncbi:unnamed protein product [Rotaria socialis]|uniref:TLDc domain-containing protein n=1 Tax=Rotaria socialis TaxID=392032 RepID=A0A820DCI0_9BILA|nr:unnamed protein product [Rotaria socialis]CAF4230011.1 unnamed protein product [Rotaria socialis]
MVATCLFKKTSILLFSIVKQLPDQYRTISNREIDKKELALFSGNKTLLNKEQQMLINRSFRTGKRWSLIYKATEHGFSSGDFHRLCDNHGATLTLIETRRRLHRRKHNSIFRGYITILWSSQHRFHHDPQTFLFLLSQDYIIRCYLRSNDQIAVSHYSTTGPGFSLNDIYICDQSNQCNLSHSEFPYSYENLEENGKGRKTFSKSNHFCVHEIELYAAIA